MADTETSIPNLRRLRFLIEDDLKRDDFANQVPKEINLAIERFQSEFFYPGLTTVAPPDPATVTTVSGQAYYTIPPILLTLSLVQMNYFGNWQELDRAEIEDILRWDSNAVPILISPPDKYAVQANQIRLYPIPDGEYPLQLTGTGKIPAPVTDDDINFWTLEAASLIRHAVTAEIRRSKIGDIERAVVDESRAEIERQRLHSLSATRETLGQVACWL